MLNALDRLFTPGLEAPDLRELIESLSEGDMPPEPRNPLDIDRAGGQSGQVAMDPEGFIHGRAAVFANDSDLRNYAQTGSLAKGDPGVGAWGAFTAGGTPYVAVPRDVLAKVYGSENAAKGKRVMVISPGGESAVIEIGDKGPKLANRRNDAVLELNPAATRLLGSGDARGYRYKFLHD